MKFDCEWEERKLAGDGEGFGVQESFSFFNGYFSFNDTVYFESDEKK